MYRLKILIFLTLFSSCATRQEKNLANISFFNSENKKTFSFTVSESFINDIKNSKPSDLYSKMTVAELKLLKNLLKSNGYCFDQKGNLSFKINSKQEKVYDITFYSLIEQNYNSKPVSPLTYFGECL